MHTLEDQKQERKIISYGGHERRILDMEDFLMKHLSMNRSQLHKNLVRERYAQVKYLYTQ